MESADILYFSTAPPPSCPSASSAAGPTNPPSITAPAVERRGISTDPTFMVVDGSTLTFPSLYMVISGTLAVRDDCGTLGNVYSHVTIPIKPGGLSTISFSASDALHAREGSTVGSFDPALPASCRTYGAADPDWETLTQSTGNFTTTITTSYVALGPPYWPILSPPIELLEYDPEWKASCPYWHTDGGDFDLFYHGIFDPPRVLTPVSAIAPQTTSTSHTVKHAPWMTAAPAASISFDGPSPTSTTLTRAESSASYISKNNVDPTPSRGDDPRIAQETIIQSISVSPSDHKLNTQTNSHSGDRDTQALPDPLLQPSSSTLNYELDSQPRYNVNGQNITPGGSAVMVDGVQYSLDNPATALWSDGRIVPLDSPTESFPDLIIDQQTVSAGTASMYTIAEQTLQPEAPAILVSGTSYSLAKSATALVVGSSTLLLDAFQPDSPPLSINGKIYSADVRPRLKFKGSEIVAGGPPATINNVPHSLDPSAIALYAGSNIIAVSSLTQRSSEPSSSPDIQDTIPVPLIIIGSITTTLHPSATNQPLTLTINSTPYTADPQSAFIIGSQTLAPGGSAITFNSIRYSLPPPTTSSSLFSSYTTTPQIQAAITVNSSLYTCIQNTPCTIASQVLSPKGTITIGAETLVYGPEGIDVISQTEVIQTPSAGPIITSHISGLTPIGEETAAPAVGDGNGGDVEGGARRRVGVRILWIILIAVGMVVSEMV
ncbi:MAG: hypothetical protein Q9180_003863 [Flavoplaca navasiana]